MDREAILYAAGSIGSIYVVIYIMTGTFAPAFFLRYMSLELDGPERSEWLYRDRRPVRYAKIAATFICAVYFVYRATQPLVDWMPFDWGAHDEDGDWIAARDSTRAILTFFGAVWAMLSPEVTAAALRKGTEK